MLKYIKRLEYRATTYIVLQRIDVLIVQCVLPEPILALKAFQKKTIKVSSEANGQAKEQEQEHEQAQEQTITACGVSSGCSSAVPRTNDSWPVRILSLM